MKNPWFIKWFIISLLKNIISCARVYAKCLKYLMYNFGHLTSFANPQTLCRIFKGKKGVWYQCLDEFWSIVRGRFLQDIFSVINPRLQFLSCSTSFEFSAENPVQTLLKQSNSQSQKINIGEKFDCCWPKPVSTAGKPAITTSSSYLWFLPIQH